MASDHLEQKTSSIKNEKRRQPAIFVNHGAGPEPYLYKIGSNKNSGTNQFILESLNNLSKHINEYQPKAIIIISAHWEENEPTLIYHQTPNLYFDYYHFPKESYAIQYPVPCAMNETLKIYETIKQSGLFKNVVLNKKRGWDHGVFIPLIIAREKADIPIIQLSLLHVNSFNSDKKVAEYNMKLGSLLYQFRNNDIMVIGSGLSYHNFGGFGQKFAVQESKNFDNWLSNTLCNKTLNQSMLELINWMNAPNARDCHKREEHLLPLHVCLGSCVDIQTLNKFINNDKNEIKEYKTKITAIKGIAMGVHCSGFIME